MKNTLKKISFHDFKIKFFGSRKRKDPELHKWKDRHEIKIIAEKMGYTITDLHNVLFKGEPIN